MRDNASPAAPVLHQNRPNIFPLEGDIDLHVSPAVTESLGRNDQEKTGTDSDRSFPGDLHR